MSLSPWGCSSGQGKDGEERKIEVDRKWRQSVGSTCIMCKATLICPGRTITTKSGYSYYIFWEFQRHLNASQVCIQKDGGMRNAEVLAQKELAYFDSWLQFSWLCPLLLQQGKVTTRWRRRVLHSWICDLCLAGMGMIFSCVGAISTCQPIWTYSHYASCFYLLETPS